MSDLPLSGVTVIDVTGYISGPTCTGILASMGAEVLKIEPPEGDNIRNFGPYVGERSYPFEFLNHNKKSVLLDLKDERGIEAIHRLVADGDVFVQNWRPGTAARLGLDYDDLKGLNPELVYCSISGFGRSGPYADRGAVDIVAQAMGGLMGVTGEPGRPPVKVSYPMTDVGSALWSVISIMAALRVRDISHQGQLVDVALLDSPVSWSFWEAAQYFAGGQVPEPLGSSHRNATPYRAFKCSDDKYIAVGVASQPLWLKFCEAIGAEDLTSDARFPTNDERRKHRNELEALLEPIFETRTRAQWLEILNGVGTPTAPVYRYDEVVSDPQVQARGLIASVAYPDGNEVRIPDVPLFMSETPREPMAPAPVAGEHTEYALEKAGYTAAAVEKLVRSGVAWTSRRPKGASA